MFKLCRLLTVLTRLTLAANKIIKTLERGSGPEAEQDALTWLVKYNYAILVLHYVMIFRL